MPTSWEALKAERGDTPEARQGYDRARRLHETGDTVRSLRLKQGLSQREVSARARVAVSTLARLESGETMPTVDALARISEVLGARLEMAIVSTR